PGLLRARDIFVCNCAVGPDRVGIFDFNPRGLMTSMVDAALTNPHRLKWVRKKLEFDVILSEAKNLSSI
ncbi:MAG TPA: hypothetical protein VGR55_06725, partial [Candidatus Acidoferrum sp.]|nr:hypothetical protein [Candidatus Acidoferrum sp.]